VRDRRIHDPKGLRERVLARGGDGTATGSAEVHATYERMDGAISADGSEFYDEAWRCHLHMPLLDGTQEHYGGKLGDPVAWGDGRTKEEAREVAMKHLQGAFSESHHISRRVKIEDRLRRGPTR
jgi:hypothetical protein